MRGCFELRARSSLDDLSKISDFILASTRGAELDHREKFHLMMAVDEACANIIKYASSEEIDVKCEVEDDLVVVEIRDEGVAFNPLEAPKADIDAPLDEREVGGLGIYLIRTLMDDVKYERQGRKNVLTMTLRHHQNLI